MRKILVLNILCLFFISCETALDIELPRIQSKLVINSYMIADQYWDKNTQFLLVSNSINGLASLDEYMYTDSVPVISTATASIDEINYISNDILESYPLEFDYNCYCYTNPVFTPKQNSTYQLNVSVEGFDPITAKERVPSKPDYTISDFLMTGLLDSSLDSDSEWEDLCEFSITIKDPPNESNYYRLKVFVEIDGPNNQTRGCKYKVEDPAFLIPINRYKASNNYYNGKNGYFTDDLFDGEEKTFFVEVEKPIGMWSHFYVAIESYSENLYRFNLTRKEQKRDLNNMLFNSEPIFIESNISEGYGIFGARAISRKAYLPLFYPTNGWVDY